MSPFFRVVCSARRLLLVSVVVVALGLGVSPVPAGASPAATAGWPNSIDLPPGTNWVLTKAMAARPTDISSPYEVKGRWTGPGPLVIGFALASRGGDHVFAWSTIHRHRGPGTVLALAGGPANNRVEMRISLDERGNFRASPVWIQNVNATKLAMLTFAVNGVISEVDWWPLSPTGERKVTSTIRAGKDAAALMVGQPSSGAAAAAGAVAVGAESFQRSIPRGIVGGIEWLTCQACIGTWTAPGGSENRWATFRHHAWAVCWCGASVSINTSFVGPAGMWRWDWAGASAPEPSMVLDAGVGYLVSEPVAAAYAPIGPDWKLWRMCRQGHACL